MVSKIVLGSLLGLLIGTPISRIMFANSQVPYLDQTKSNVVYDLKCLFGDENKDGILSKEEYESFDVSSLVKDRNRDEKVTFLGANPIDATHMSFYLYSRIDFTDNAASSLEYSNAVEQDKATGVFKENSFQASATLKNYYRNGSDSIFYKFVIEDYRSTPGEDMRFRPIKFSTAGNGATFSQQIPEDCQIFYNGYGMDAVSTFFNDRVYYIDGAVDMMLASTEQVSSAKHEGWFFFIPSQTTGQVVEAKEVPYFFFDFKDDGFNPDDIKSVTWQCYMITYRYTDYYNDQVSEKWDGGDSVPRNGFRGIYRGKYDDDPKKGAFGDPGWYGTSKDKKGNDVIWWDKIDIENPGGRFYKGKVVNKPTTVIQTDKLNGWKHHDPISRKYIFPNIVNMKNVDEYFPTEENEGTKEVKEFIKGSDHMNYEWAYALQDNAQDGGVDFVRSCKENQRLVTTEGLKGSGVYETVTTCHQPVNDSVVTLAMTVVIDEKDYDIRVMNDPKSVRDVYMVGYPAPKLTDFYKNDLSVAFKNYEWLIWAGIAVIALLVIGLVVRLVRWAKGGSSKRYK